MWNRSDYDLQPLLWSVFHTSVFFDEMQGKVIYDSAFESCSVITFTRTDLFLKWMDVKDNEVCEVQLSVVVLIENCRTYELCQKKLLILCSSPDSRANIMDH
jgi:hypothetical protein